MERPEPQLRAELIDEITEAVVKADEPSGRARVIADLVHEVDEVVKWRHQPHPGSEEEQSLSRLVEAASTHQHDMDTLDGSTDLDDTSDPDDRTRSALADEREVVDPSAPRRAARRLRRHL